MYITNYIEEYGVLEGLAKFFTRKRMSYEVLTLLADAPEDCPWFALRELKPEWVVEEVFAPLADRFPGTVEQLREYCQAVACLRAEGVWYLLYLMHFYEEYICWIGREPAESPALPDAVRAAGWELPEPLAEFYRVHHGFGESDIVSGAGFDAHLWNALCIRPAHRLELLDRETEGEEEVEYGPGKILFFFHDGGGDYEGFLPRIEGEEWLVAYYNHEEDYVEDSLAGDFCAAMDEWFEEQFV